MRQERLGSYSMVRTVPGTSYLSRLKSMTRYMRLLPPPRCRAVTRPLLLRPPLFLSGSSSGLCGSTGWFLPSCLVNSENVETDRKRRPGVMGLYFRIGTGCFPHRPPRARLKAGAPGRPSVLDALEQHDRLVRRDDRFLPGGRVAGPAAAAPQRAPLLAFHAHGIDREDMHRFGVRGVDRLDRLGDLDLIGIQPHPEVELIERGLIRALFRQQGPLDNLMRA